jgi:hypothetical protein
MNDLVTWLAAGVMALALAGSMVLDGPTETQAAQDVADEVASLTGGAK